MTKPPLKLESVKVVWEPDPFPPDPTDDNADAVLESCHAVATVSYPCGQGNLRLETLTSGGLYGIDRADGAYRREIEHEELADLCEHLAVFGVPLDDFGHCLEAYYLTKLHLAGLTSRERAALADHVPSLLS